MSSTETPSLQERMKLYEINPSICENAINGIRLPLALGLPQVQACIIRGIRHHDGFGEELRGIPQFDRALNARAIMSNRIPEIEDVEAVPYCIWYPEVASEDTYRKLAQRYPSWMRYHVGRACAVAGYVNLYQELDPVPDVAIAEEARDNERNGSSMQIFEHIMAAPTLYTVMNDYTREVNTENPTSDAFLNADTAVRSTLNRKISYPYEESSSIDDSLQSFDLEQEDYVPYDEGDTYWNITEDWKFDIEESPDERSENEDLRIPLLSAPLPRHLPNINKDILILHAAYTGNIDRYARLRRPSEIWAFEQPAILRGIYFNIAFAKWWFSQPQVINDPHSVKLEAIHARYIMSNNLSLITEDTSEAVLPYLIYYPNVADEKIYEHLFDRKPCMKLQIARACIIANYEELYRKMDVPPDEYLMIEAKNSSNPFYIVDQERKAKEQNYVGEDDYPTENVRGFTITELMSSNVKYLREAQTEKPALDRMPIIWGGKGGIWNDSDIDMSYIELAIGWTMKSPGKK